MPESGNPARIRSALSFAALYVLILLAVAFTRDHLGDEAFYLVAAVSGLTDVDALTISTAQLFAKQQVSADTAWRAIFLASLSNLLFKGGAAAVLGSPALRRAIVMPFLSVLLAGGCVFWLWP